MTLENKNFPSIKEAVYWNRKAKEAVTDEAAFTEIYHCFFPVLYKRLLYMSGDSEAADEAISRAFLKMYDYLSGFDEKKASFATWFFRIAENELRMMFREKRRTLEAAWDENFDPPAPGAYEPESRLLQKEEQRALYEALSALSERDRKIVEMTYWLGMSSEETAKRLGMEANTMRVALKRAREKLKKYLEQADMSGK